jgi:hypothetical protein
VIEGKDSEAAGMLLATWTELLRMSYPWQVGAESLLGGELLRARCDLEEEV